MKFSVITLFPDLIASWSQTGLVGTAIQKGLIEVVTVNPRDFAMDRHKSVDDTAFGGSDGMVMKFEPMAKAIESLGSAHVAFLTPQGRAWQQSTAETYSREIKHIVLVCGRYAGFDQRLIEVYADAEISVGDYILNGGEVASLVVMESISRLQAGVLGNAVSVQRESFSEGLLEAPVFTRPREIAGLPVPDPLLSGNHAEIERFEKDVALVRTHLLRPDLGVSTADLREARKRLQALPTNQLSALGLDPGDLKRGES